MSHKNRRVNPDLIASENIREEVLLKASFCIAQVQTRRQYLYLQTLITCIRSICAVLLNLVELFLIKSGQSCCPGCEWPIV